MVKLGSESSANTGVLALRTAAAVLGRKSEAEAIECLCKRLHVQVGAKVELRSLSEQTGLSRFQLLRAFKRKYGLPPHAYHLRMRIGLAQGSLRAGSTLAAVAAEYGFFDQSHFSKHFKRVVGLTPGQYAPHKLTRKTKG